MNASTYATNKKALRRWASERLTLVDRADGGIDARFVYDGSTCSNMGRAIRFVYDVRLGSSDAGYPILGESCAPDESVEGYKFMCRYRATDGGLMDSIASEKPLLGRSLNDALEWERPAVGASCYCELENRTHKWALVFETIHFALSMRDEIHPAVVVGG